MWHEVDGNAVAREEKNAALPALAPEQVEEAVAVARLHLYNQGRPCGAAALRRYLHDQQLRPLPSTRRIGRLLTLYGLTYGRTGWYGEGTAEEMPAGLPPSAWVPPAQRRYLTGQDPSQENHEIPLSPAHRNDGPRGPRPPRAPGPDVGDT